MVKNLQIIEQDLYSVFSTDWLRKIAQEMELIKRERKIDPVIIFWVLVLGFGVRLQRTLASLNKYVYTFLYVKEKFANLIPGHLL